MTRRLAVIATWLLAGHALLLALFWGLLNVPESSAWMLALSAAVAIVLIVAAGALHAGAALAWQHDGPVERALLAGTRHVPAFLLATLLFWAIWWATAQALEWHARLSGQMDAWFIARTGRPDTAWLHALVFWTIQFVRWSIGLTLALSFLGAFVGRGVRTLRSTGWLTSALHPRRWLMVTFWLVLLIAIPWQAVDWRPRQISLVLEPWFVAAKLGAIAIAASVGWALMLRVCARPVEIASTTRPA